MLRISDAAAGVQAEIGAVLIDMDGTLVDSSAAVERAWRSWAAVNGVDGEEVVAVCHGATADGIITRFRPDFDAATVARHVAAHMTEEIDDTGDITALPGAHRLLAVLAGLGLPWALVTNANRELAQARTRAAGIFPQVYATVEEVAGGKPDPALYLLAARRLGLEPGQCLVVEDSPSGVAAGRAAGAVVAAIGRDDGHLRIGGLDDIADLLLAAAAGG